MAWMNSAAWQSRVGAETFREMLLPGIGAGSRSLGPLHMSCDSHMGSAHPLPQRELPLRGRGLTLKEASLPHFTARQVKAQNHQLSHLASGLECEADCWLDSAVCVSIIKPCMAPTNQHWLNIGHQPCVATGHLKCG